MMSILGFLFYMIVAIFLVLLAGIFIKIGEVIKMKIGLLGEPTEMTAADMIGICGLVILLAVTSYFAIGSYIGESLPKEKNIIYEEQIQILLNNHYIEKHSFIGIEWYSYAEGTNNMYKKKIILPTNNVEIIEGDYQPCIKKYEVNFSKSYYKLFARISMADRYPIEIYLPAS